MRSISINFFKLFVCLFLFGVADLFPATPIASVSDWNSFVSGTLLDSNGYYYLDADIGSLSAPVDRMYSGTFTGYLDGMGKKITVNISSNSTNVGLFSQLGSGSAVNDLIIDGSITGTSSNANVGGLVGLMLGSYVSHITNFANVTGSGVNSSVGGIAGRSVPTWYSFNSFYITYMFQCNNSGTISGGHYVAGIIGSVIDTIGSDTHILSCRNSGTITGSGQSQNSMGGIIGYISCGALAVSSAVNVGKILSINSDYAGGIVGFIDKNRDLTVALVCLSLNSGIVAGGNIGVGGIVGYANNSVGVFRPLHIGSSINTNWVTGGATYSGGIIGRSSNCEFSDCFYDNQMCLLGGIGGVDVSGQAEGVPTLGMLGNNLSISSSSTLVQLYPLPGRSTHTDLHPIELLAIAPMYLMNNEKINNITTFPFYVSNGDSYCPPSFTQLPASPYSYQWSSFSNGTIINVPASPSNNVTKNNSGQDTLRVKIDNEPYEKVVPVNAP